MTNYQIQNFHVKVDPNFFSLLSFDTFKHTLYNNNVIAFICGIYAFYMLFFSSRFESFYFYTFVLLLLFFITLFFIERIVCWNFIGLYCLVKKKKITFVDWIFNNLETDSNWSVTVLKLLNKTKSVSLK